MRERIVDIIAWAVTQMQQDKLNKKELDILLEKGFSQKEISIAFSWLSDKFDTKVPNELILSITHPPNSFRFLTKEERNFFTDDAYNTIMKFVSIGLIRSFHIEMIMEKVLSLGLYEINNDLVRQFVAHYMFDVPTPDENLVRFNFCGNESIN